MGCGCYKQGSVGRRKGGNGRDGMGSDTNIDGFFVPDVTSKLHPVCRSGSDNVDSTKVL